jgi:UDP-3-O-[3-hydroxymyristoyl] glucosamine N-acyltransferase
LSFIRLLQWAKSEQLLTSSGDGEIHASVTIHPTAIIDPGARIGASCEIGPRTYVGSGSEIGSNVWVGAGSIIGHSGFGYERDENGVPVRFPHIGKVIIEEGCEIGCNTTIARGSLGSTRVRANAKIDDQVYIAHNCEIGISTMIAGGAMICGSVVIGSHCWIGAGAMIRQGIEIGPRALVGLGAVVVNAVAADSTVAGNPARLVRDRKCVE